MNSVTFSAIKNTQSNQQWLNNFNLHWPAYKSWYQSRKNGQINSTNLRIAEKTLNGFMPEITPIYQQLKHLVNDNPVACQFLTLHQPPAYLINCSQIVLSNPEPTLIRNYDLSPDLSENTIFYTDWLDRKVISTNECLWGADDGINDAGLAISLTFGGRKAVGTGFGIPIILRYILQTCETTKQAVKQLRRIPSHMSYNITVVDKSGDYATVHVAPDRQARVTKDRIATNHQQTIEWQEQANFSKTLERKEYLEKLIQNWHNTATPVKTGVKSSPQNLDSHLRGNDERLQTLDAVPAQERHLRLRSGTGIQSSDKEKSIINAFLQPPLYSGNYQQNFGTVYTAVYKPENGSMAYHWPNQQWQHSFKQFNAGQITIQLGPSANILDQWQSTASYPNNLLPKQVKTQFDCIFDYLPESVITNNAAFNKFKQNLRSNPIFNWQQFNTAMQEIWQ